MLFNKGDEGDAFYTILNGLLNLIDYKKIIDAMNGEDEKFEEVILN